ncbi:MAG: prepilin-type N-terminal cleavage/methylation domain-containing protein, partial [Planctomycetes bacterium]|nr:prepilin-type N-terminal cleavage/methylation domain-containing protein [Planctomycetota bacterium]
MSIFPSDSILHRSLVAQRRLRGAAAPEVACNAGFTLVELLVALGLAAIISLCIARVGSQSEAVYVAVTAKVDLYRRMRYALADLHDTIANWLPT